MRIGEVADELGVATQTVRFYEQRGLLPQPQRAPNGYRDYDQAAIDRLRFIRSAQTAGLTLAEIAGIIEVRDHGTAPCAHVADLLRVKLDEIRERQHQLAALESEVTALIELAHRLDPADCSDTDVCHILARARQPG